MTEENEKSSNPLTQSISKKELIQILITVSFLGGGYLSYQNITETKEQEKLNALMTVSPNNLGPRLWREVIGNCEAYQQKTFWTLLQRMGISQNGVTFFTVDGDSGYISAKKSSSFHEWNKTINIFYSDSIQTELGTFDPTQKVITTWSVNMIRKQCNFYLSQAKPAREEDLISFGERKIQLLQDQNKRQ